DITLGAEGAFVDLLLCALVDERAINARERGLVCVVLEEVLPHLGPYELEEIAQVADHGIVAAHGVSALVQVYDTQYRKRSENTGWQEPPAIREQAKRQENEGRCNDNVESRVARQEVLHGAPF